ncbi:MAG: enoyl-CoA hydratase/isomerase family protein, partial [Burkholderiales bacterium]|nr:enoyl-CoA hydratase/isomerase family protein [Burkholderiales bacterium]
MDPSDYRSSTERVQVQWDGSTLHIQFNNPARHNALSVDMWEAIPPLLNQAAADERVRLIVFSGAGEKAFVSGADISQFEDQRAAQQAVARYEAMAEAALTGIERCPVPTLACIRGWCIGGGVNVAIACDIRIAAADAVFSVPAARLGLGYRYSAMKNLVDLLGP